ncbi:MAG: hypothetical protein AB3N16_14755 [Flavobacteriaceae bacterium]
MKRNIFAVLVVSASLFFASCSSDDNGGDTPSPNLDTPKVSVDKTSINFGDLDVNQESSVESVSVTAEHLQGDVTATAPDGFQISLSQDANFAGEVTLTSASLSNGAVALYAKATPMDDFEGSLSGNIELSSTGASNVSVALSANVALVINGKLFMSEYFEQYGSEWTTTLPLDFGILGWNTNTAEFVADNATLGDPFPASTVPNNEVYNTWYLPVPLNGKTLRGSLGLSDNSTLSVTGYPSVTGSRDMVLDPDDESQYWNWINKNNGKCIAGKEEGNNTSAGRRFAADGYTGDVFMSALVNIKVLGAAKEGSEDLKGSGDIIALANATSGPSNNNTIKIVALTDGAGGFNLGLLKENEGNPAVLSTDSYSLNTTYVIVLSHEFVEGDNNDISKLYVFKEGDDIPTSMDGLTPVAILDDTYTHGVDPADLSIVYLRERRQSVINPEANITGIRVGDTWIATLFADHGDAENSNDLSLNGRVLVNEGSDCTP